MRPIRPGPNALLTTQELHDQKLTPKQIARLVELGRLVRMHRGVYFVVGIDALSRSALLAVGEGSTLCLESALSQLDLRPWVPTPVHVNAPTTNGRSRGERIRVHRARLPESDVGEVRGMRVTSPTRTLLDVAPRRPRYALFRALEQAERLRLDLDRTRLAACRHLAQPLELFDHYGPCTRSDAEAMFLFLCEDHGIERPLVNQPVAGREADIHWPAEHLLVEIDGYEFHNGKPVFHDDRHKGAAFRRAGFEVIRFSAHQVEHEAAVVAETVLAARPRLAC